MEAKNAQARTGKQVYCSICSCYIPSASLVESHEKGKKHLKFLNKKKHKIKSMQCSVYVRGFQHNQSDLENQLRDLFSKYGKVKEIYIDKEKSSYALVEFEDENGVQRLLLERDKQILEGKKLLIKPRKPQIEPECSQEKQVGNEEQKHNLDVWLILKKVLGGSFAKCNDVSSKMILLVEEMQLTADDIKIRKTLCELLEEIFKEVYPDCHVLPFGSSVTQLGFRNCDLDVTLVSKEFNELQNEAAANDKEEYKNSSSSNSIDSKSSSKANRAIHEVSEILRRFAPGCKNVITLKSAHCPIVKFHHKDSGLNCDLSINNRLALKNSELLSCYSRTDARFRPLAYTIRLWAKSKRIAGKNGFQVTQYALAVMLIHFLQQISPAVLPCLQQIENKNDKKSEKDWLVDGWQCYFCDDIEDLNNSKNSMTCEKLLLGFFRYFSQFDYESRVLSIKTTSQLTRRSFKEHFLESGIEYSFKEGPVCIVDPFELTHNIAQNMTSEGLENFKDEINESLRKLGELFEAKKITDEKDDMKGDMEINKHSISNSKFIELFEPKKDTKESKRKRKSKLKFTFDVYHDDKKSSNSKCQKCTDIILQILQEDLKMHTKVDYDARKATSMADEGKTTISQTGLRADELKNEVAETNEDRAHAIQRLQEENTSNEEDALMKETCSSEKPSRKRSAIDDEELAQPPNKVVKISDYKLESSESDASVVEIHATAWANTWTHRRKQRRIIDVLKDDHIEASMVPLLANAPSLGSTDSAVFLSTKTTPSGPSGSARSDAQSSTGLLNSSTINPNLGQEDSSLETCLSLNKAAENGPIIMAAIKIVKKPFQEHRCRVEVQMTEARSLSAFHTFFAFFKKQVLSKLKR